MKRDFLWPHLKELPYFRAALRSVEARIMAALDFPTPILDLGCGDGHFASVAFVDGLDMGVDPAWFPLLEAKERGVYRTLCQATGERLPYRDGAFLSAFSNSVLEHIPQLDQVLQEVCRVLQPGAPFAITVPNPGYRARLSVPLHLRKVGLAPFGRAYERWFMRVTRTYNLFEEDEWASRLESAGFRVEHSRRYFSSDALRMLEWGHYFGLPSLVSRWLTGKWIIVPSAWNLKLTEKIVRRYYDEPLSEEGTYSFFLARKL